jgi:hypothetical protein
VFPKNLSSILFAAVVVSAAAQTSRVGAVGRISILNENPLQIQVQTTEGAVPQVQMVSSPERLVIDIPNTVPGASLHGLTVNRGDVRGVRVSQYSVRPPVTRVVVDLNSPQWYRVVPNAVGLVISLGSDRATADAAQPAIGWVSSVTRGTRPPPVVLMRAVATQPQRNNGVSVVFARGLLTIHAQNATLSEVLFQIQKQTGAEIAIPAGTEQDRVAADFGPGTPSTVMGDLLNGSGLNFVVVGSASDPNQLRSVILSRKTGGVDPPGGFQAADNPPPQAVPAMDPSNLQSEGPPPENPPQEAPINGPPPEQVPN